MIRKLRTPENYEEMIKMFGNIRSYIFEDGSLDSAKWESFILDFCYIPFSMKLAWNKTISVTKFRCHYLLVSVFSEIFREILIAGLENYCQFFGGCYIFRSQKGSKKLSTHCWGIAIDINPETNKLGTKGDMHPDIIRIFEDYGFDWGGNFEVPDPMHFQFVKGY